MTLHSNDQTTIRQYLLGELSDEAQRQQVEERLLTDGDFFQELEITEDELIDQYLTGALTADERRNFESHFLAAPERQRKLSFARALRKCVEAAAVETRQQQRSQRSKSEQAPLWVRLLANPYLRSAAACLVLLTSGLVVWRAFFYQSETSKGLLALAQAYQHERPVEARLSALGYAPRPATRGGEPAKVDQTSLARADSLLRAAEHDESGPASLHALGLLDLAEQKFEAATNELKMASEADPQNARLHSDLGAAWLEWGKADRANGETGQSLEAFARSREQLSKALELDGSLLEALFNRALSYEASGLPEEAEADWHKYLEHDPNSQWANEAREHLRSLEQQRSSVQTDAQMLEAFLVARQQGDDEQAWQLVTRSNSSAGNLLTNQLLDSYLKLETQGQHSAAKSKLDALAYLGRLEQARTGDRYTSDLANFYHAVAPVRLATLATARTQMQQGYELFTQSDYEAALTAYGAAKQTFEQERDTSEALFASYRTGHCHVLMLATDKGQTIFADLTTACQSREYKWLLAQCLYESAHIQTALSEYSKAIDYSAQALQLLEQLDDTNGLLKNLVQMAGEYDSLNDGGRSVGYLQRGLFSIVKGYPVPIQGCWELYIAIALNLNARRLYPAALEYQTEALRLALALNRPLLISRSYVYLSLIYSNLKNYDEAFKNIQLAFATAKSLEGKPAGKEMNANASLQLGDIYQQLRDYDKALAAYNQGIKLYDQELNFKYFTYLAHKRKLLCYEAQGNDAAVEAELQTILPLFDQYRAKITEEGQRESFFDTEQKLYDLAIDFAQTRKANARQAFEYSEDSRARVLLDIIQQGAHVIGQESDPGLGLTPGAQPLPLPELQQAMPEHVQIVQYAVLENRLLIWVISRNDFRSVAPVEISAKALTEKVKNYLSLINDTESDRTESAQAAEELYDILIKPVASSLDADTELLCIVPDKMLNSLPYSALRAPATGRYLIQDHTLEQAPSANIFIACSNIARKLGGLKDEHLLSVGNPSFNHDRFPTLSDLPDASREAKTVASYYSAPSLLLEGGARVEAIKRELVRADVLHFAGHYVVDKHSAMLSKLVLARASNDSTQRAANDDVLPAYELYQMKLPLTRLVVLSACQTGIERHYGGEGAVGLARPFIAAGVPLVVASLWPVDSNPTADLMIAFHRHRKQDQDGVTTAKALQRAQLELLQGEDERYRQPYYWASFIAIGGHTDY